MSNENSVAWWRINPTGIVLLGIFCAIMGKILQPTSAEQIITLTVLCAGFWQGWMPPIMRVFHEDDYSPDNYEPRGSPSYDYDKVGFLKRRKKSPENAFSKFIEEDSKKRLGTNQKPPAVPNGAFDDDITF